MFTQITFLCHSVNEIMTRYCSMRNEFIRQFRSVFKHRLSVIGTRRQVLSIGQMFGVFTIIAFMGCLCSCSPEDLTPISPSPAFFKQRIGSYHIYMVQTDSINPSSLTHHTFELRQAVIDSIQNADSTITYLIERAIRDHPTSPWRALDTWASKITETELIVQEGNVPYVKLFFPIAHGISWDGNKYNSLAAEHYFYSKVNENYLLLPGHGAPPRGFNYTTTVIQSDTNDLVVKYDFRKEVFARNVGLIFKETIVLNYCNQPDCAGQQRIESGLILKQSLIEYGIR